jgi:hypothetical protein
MNNIMTLWYISLGMQLIYLIIYMFVFIQVAFRNSIHFHSFKKKIHLFNVQLRGIDYFVGGLIIIFQLTFVFVLGFEPRFRWLLIVNIFAIISTITSLYNMYRLSNYNRDLTSMINIYSSVKSKVSDLSSIMVYYNDLKGVYEKAFQYQINMLSHLNQIKHVSVDIDLFKQDLNSINEELERVRSYIEYVNSDLIDAFNKRLLDTIKRLRIDNESFKIKSYEISIDLMTLKEEVFDKVKNVALDYVINSLADPNSISLEGYKHIIILYRSLDTKLKERFYEAFLKSIHLYQSNFIELLAIFLDEELIPLELITEYFIKSDVEWFFNQKLLDFYDSADRVKMLRLVIEHNAINITNHIIKEFSIDVHTILHQALMKKHSNKSYESFSLLYHFIVSQKYYINYPNGLENMALSLLNYSELPTGTKNIIKSIFINEQRQLLEKQKSTITSQYESAYNTLFMRTKYIMLQMLAEIKNTQLELDKSINPELLLPFYVECVANLRADDLRVFTNVFMYFLFISVSTEEDFKRLQTVYKQDPKLFMVDIGQFKYDQVYQIRDLFKKSLRRDSIRSNLTRIINEIEFNRLLIKRFID